MLATEGRQTGEAEQLASRRSGQNKGIGVLVLLIVAAILFTLCSNSIEERQQEREENVQQRAAEAQERRDRIAAERTAREEAAERRREARKEDLERRQAKQKEEAEQELERQRVQREYEEQQRKEAGIPDPQPAQPRRENEGRDRVDIPFVPGD